SITAIGMRPIADCINIFHTLQTPLHLDFLELAIGSPCPTDYPYPNVPLLLHDNCLYHQRYRLRLNPLCPKTWQPYAQFIATHNVCALSLHPPRRPDCTRQELESTIAQLQQTLQVPVFLEVMPFPEHWCSSPESLVDCPLLLDVSHVLIWHRGDWAQTEQTCETLLQSGQVGAIHLSHNRGKADSHDLIPADVWFSDRLDQWRNNYLVTYESLPRQYGQYQRRDRLRCVERNRLRCVERDRLHCVERNRASHVTPTRRINAEF
ncbi:MAG: hypothetical protein F6J87_23345, partial [Spirulina sp. SIO3F2]|nr:hypothetical protein [Spirulina sp. SIO3F2]